MTIVFVLIAALLVLAALAVVIWPLLRPMADEPNAAPQDNSERLAVLADSLRELKLEFAAGTLQRGEYEEAKTELERQAVDADAMAARRTTAAGRSGWLAAMAVAIALPVVAIALYVAMGQPAALQAPTQVTDAQRSIGDGQAHIQTMIAALRERLQQDSQDARGWTMLARAYAATGQAQEAIKAYAKAVALKPDTAGLLVEYANALGMFHDRNLRGKPQQLLERALALQPDNPNALALAGAAALQRGDRVAAVQYWQQLQQLLPPDSAKYARVARLIARAQGERLEQPQQKQSVAIVEAAIHGTITVSKALQEKITAGDTLFIFARAPDGPPMPLAVLRRPAPQFPLQFTLDDSHAMVSGVHLSQYSVVNIVARVSRTGTATLQPGDLEGRAQSVPIGTQDVRIIIDDRVGS